MDKKLIGLSTLFVLAFLVFTGYVFFSGSFNVLTRAAVENTNPSEQNSLIFAWPLSLPADGQSSSEVTVFVRNVDGKGLEGKQVTLTTSVGSFQAGSAVTDTDGKAIFNLTSSSPGVAEIDAMVDNKKLLRKITVEFK